MLDYHKGVGTLAEPILQVINNTNHPFEAFGTTFTPRSSGVYVTDKYNSYKNNFRLTLKYPDLIIVENSVHKYSQGGLNVFDFNHSQMIQELESIYKGLNVSDWEAVKIYQPEFECPIQMDNPEMFYNSLKTFRNKWLMDLGYKGNIYGKSFQTDYYKIKIYSKHLQMKKEQGAIKDFECLYPESMSYLKQNLRIEFVPLKSRYFKSNRPLIVKDLKDKEFMNKLYDGFITKFCKIERDKLFLKASSYSATELEAFAIYSHPGKHVRQRMKQEHMNKHKYLKSLYNNLPTKYLSTEELFRKLNNKKNTLLN